MLQTVHVSSRNKYGELSDEFPLRRIDRETGQGCLDGFTSMGEAAIFIQPRFLVWKKGKSKITMKGREGTVN